MSALDEIIGHIEMHSPEGIRECFSDGVDPNQLFRGEPLIYELTSEYTRTPKFKDCVQAFVDFGLKFKDKALLAVLLDDAVTLNDLLKSTPELTSRKYSLRCAYTPLEEVSLLHVCAEFNHTRCAAVLCQHGADVDARAGIDSYGFGGQTPIFHTVNQNSNASADMLEFLLARSADLALTVRGLIWGKSYEWETLIPAVNPVSYAMMGLLPQVHRNETTIAQVVRRLLRSAYDIDYSPKNIPNAYLRN